MATVGEGVVVVVFVIFDEAVVGGVLPVVRPLLRRGVGDNGEQEVARLPAADARVVLIAVVAGDVFFSVPLLSEPPELLGLGWVVFSRVGASRPGNSGGEGAPVIGQLRGGLVRQVVLAKIDVAGTLVSPLVDSVLFGAAGGLEAVLGTSDACVVLEVPSGVLEVVPATIVVTVVVVAAAKLRVLCPGRDLCKDKLPGAVVKSLFCCAKGRRLGPAVVVVVAAFLVVAVVVVVVGVVAVTALSVLVSGDAVVAATRTVDCLAGWCLPKCSFTDLSGQCPLPMKEHSAQPHSTLAAGWKCFKCLVKLPCSLYLPLPCIRPVDSPA